MDAWGIGIFVMGLILYYALKKKAIFLFISGVGAGILIAAIWAMTIAYSVIQ
jgi:hypothetical protein